LSNRLRGKREVRTRWAGDSHGRRREKDLKWGRKGLRGSHISGGLGGSERFGVDFDKGGSRVSN